MFETRDYQEECLKTLNQLESGSFLVVMATGLGKTWIFTHIERKGRVLILSHREELVHQPERYYEGQGCSFGVERAEEHSNGEDVISASVQTLVRRLNRFAPDAFDLIVTDEAHHSVAPTYKKIYDYFHPRLHIGFTATPNRADSANLGSVYEKVVFERNIRWGIEHKWLCNIRCKRVDIGYDIQDVRITAGDFNQEDIENAVDIQECNEVVAKVCKEEAVGPTVIFTASVDHAYRLQKLIPGSEVITGETKNRDSYLDRFARGEIAVLINCMVLSEGTDLPMIRTIIICRPTTNTALYTQMVGRGLRLFQGKNELLLIDCVGASSLPICTAPVLFGLNPKETVEDGKQITELKKEVERTVAEASTSPDAWRVNMELIDLFERKGNFDTRGVNYTVCANGNLICSLGKGIRAVITPEDAVGNCCMSFMRNEEELYKCTDIPVQEALDTTFSILKNDFSDKENLWNKKKCQIWGTGLATEKQKDYIRRLFKKEALADIDFDNLTKYQAGQLIERGSEEKRIRMAAWNNPATEKQINLLRRLLPDDHLKEINVCNLTKRQASDLINRTICQQK